MLTAKIGFLLLTIGVIAADEVEWVAIPEGADDSVTVQRRLQARSWGQPNWYQPPMNPWNNAQVTVLQKPMEQEGQIREFQSQKPQSAWTNALINVISKPFQQSNPCLPSEPNCNAVKPLCPPNKPDCDELKVTVTQFEPPMEPQPVFRNAFSNNSLTNNVNFLAKAGANVKFRLTETTTESPFYTTLPPGFTTPPPLHPTPYQPTTYQPQATTPASCVTMQCWQENPCQTSECIQARISIIAKNKRDAEAKQAAAKHPRDKRQAPSAKSSILMDKVPVQQMIGPEGQAPGHNQPVLSNGILQSIAMAKPSTGLNSQPCVPTPQNNNCNGIMVSINSGQPPASPMSFGQQALEKVFGPDFASAFSNNSLMNNINFYAEEGPTVDFALGADANGQDPAISGMLALNNPDIMNSISSADLQEIVAQMGSLAASVKEEINMMIESGAQPEDFLEMFHNPNSYPEFNSLMEPFVSIGGKRQGAEIIVNHVQAAFSNALLSPHYIAFAPSKELSVLFGTGAVLSLGNDIQPAQALYPPIEIEWDTEPEQFYTLVVMDYGSNNDAPATNLWLVVNLPSDKSISKGTTLIEYMPPAPGAAESDSRIVYLIYRQPGIIAADPYISSRQYSERQQFNLAAFVKGHELGNAITGNFYVTSCDFTVSQTWHQIGRFGEPGC